ncbi:hypothetical protein [Actinoplanes sp. NPDC049802]|uniref:hypothetical protein n=1 Tax=Actinoplanes sp. NPDC049802 TaxID=3154742 RepID=UPI0033C7E812
MTQLTAMLAGVAVPWVLITGATVLQRDIPAPFLGRVSGTVTLLSFAPAAIGQATGAALLAVADYRLLLGAAAAAGLVTAMWCLRPVPEAAPAPAQRR